MSTNIRLRSVSVIVNDNFATDKIFKSHHIDFCCGGHAQLHEACRIAGADIEEVIAEIEHCEELQRVHF